MATTFTFKRKLFNDQQAATRAIERAANKAVGTEVFKTAAQTGGKDAVNALKTGASNAYKAGQTAGANSVGLMGGLKNTWSKAGMGGKAGMVGAAVVGTGLMAKGLFGNKNK